jgi:hypothetical protein
VFSAAILGMTVEVSFAGSQQLIPVAEVILGSLEAFLATAIDQRVIPHTERFRIELIEDADISESKIETSALDMTTTVTWPAGLSVVSHDRHRIVRKFVTELSGQILAATCVVENEPALLDKLYGDEAVDARMAMIATAPTSYHRLASTNMSRLSDWQEAVKKEYPLKTPRPQLKLVDFKVPESGEDDNDSGAVPHLTNHRAMRIRSVIDVHAWDQAGWKGACYLNYGPGRAPGLAFILTRTQPGKSFNDGGSASGAATQTKRSISR